MIGIKQTTQAEEEAPGYDHDTRVSLKETEIVINAAAEKDEAVTLPQGICVSRNVNTQEIETGLFLHNKGKCMCLISVETVYSSLFFTLYLLEYFMGSIKID